jgi:hypothetical protein
MTASLVAHLPASWPFGPTSDLLAELAAASEPARELACVPAGRFGPAGFGAERFALTADDRPAVVGLAGPDAVGTVVERLLRRPALVVGAEAPPGSAAAYLAGMGVNPNRLEQFSDLGQVPANAAAEAAVASLVWPPLLIEAPAAILQRIGPEETDLVTRLRERVLTEDGMSLPELTLRPAEGVGTRVSINDLAIPLPGIGESDGWRDVAAGLDTVLTSRLHWLLRADDVGTAVEELSYLMPDLARAVGEAYPIPTLTAVLRERLRRGGRLRNLGRLLWLLLDLGPVASGPDRLSLNDTAAGRNNDPDPGELASRLHKALIEDAWRVGRYHWPERVGRLSAAVEDQLVSADAETIASAEWAVIEEVIGMKGPEMLIVATVAAVTPVVECLRALAEAPGVLAADELPPDADLAGLTGDQLGVRS